MVQDVGLFESSSEPGLWSWDPPQNAIYNTFSGTRAVKNAQGDAIAPAESGFSTGDFPLRLFLLNGQPVFQETHNPTEGQQQRPIGQQLDVPRYTLRPGEVVRFCPGGRAEFLIQGNATPGVFGTFA